MRRILWGWLFLLVISCPGGLTVGCTTRAPEEAQVQKVIREYFEDRKFRVMELRTGDMSRNPLAERDYMAPLTYILPVPRITLEALEDIGTPPRYMRGQSITFEDAEIHIRRGTIPERQWEVARLSGIEIP